MVSVDSTVVSIDNSNIDDNYKSLYKLVCREECQWIELTKKLTVARSSFVAMTIPDEMTKCRAKVRTKVIFKL